MAKDTIIAQKQVGDKTVTREFHKGTWDLLPADKSGFAEVKQGKTPKEVSKPKGEQLDIPTE
jgi:hypothetical protein